MRKILAFIFVCFMLVGCFNEQAIVSKETLIAPIKGTLSKIEPVKGGYFLHALIKNGKEYKSARGFVSSLNALSSDGKEATYEVGDLLNMEIKNNVIMRSQIAIKGYTTREGSVVRSAHKRDKSKIIAPVPSETKVRF